MRMMWNHVTSSFIIKFSLKRLFRGRGRGLFHRHLPDPPRMPLCLAKVAPPILNLWICPCSLGCILVYFKWSKWALKYHYEPQYVSWAFLSVQSVIFGGLCAGSKWEICGRHVGWRTPTAVWTKSWTPGMCGTWVTRSDHRSWGACVMPG